MPTNIIIADDHPIIRNGLKTLLSDDERFNIVDELTSIFELRNYGSGKKGDIFILDIYYKGKSVLPILEDIRKNNPFSYLLLYSSFLPRNADSLHAEGIHGYVNKESNPEVLLFAMEEIAAGKTFYDFEEMASPENTGGFSETESLFDPTSVLSKRELEIAISIARGLSNREISELLNLSEHTIRTHRKHVYKKLNVNNGVDIAKIIFKSNGF